MTNRVDLECAQELGIHDVSIQPRCGGATPLTARQLHQLPTSLSTLELYFVYSTANPIH